MSHSEWYWIESHADRDGARITEVARSVPVAPRANAGRSGGRRDAGNAALERGSDASGGRGLADAFA